MFSFFVYPAMVSHLFFSGIHLGPAYLDGGTGSMMIQAAIAGILSMAFVLKSRFLLLKAAIQKKKNTNYSD